MSFGLPNPEILRKLYSDRGTCPADHSSIQLDADVLSSIDRSEGLCHTMGVQKGGYVFGMQRVSNNATCASQVIEKTARRTIRCVYGT